LAVEAVLGTLGISYATADANQLNAMSEQQLGGYKLFIVPGKLHHDRRQSLRKPAAMIRGAIQQYGVNYLGICAGAFWWVFHAQRVNLTGGVAFNFYADEFKGIHKGPSQSPFRPAARWMSIGKMARSSQAGDKS
jgi:glutamine amidotransferase-like uncharacterized protein